MTQEEKAEAYDEAIEKLRGLLEGIHEEKCEIMEEDITNIFPELAESEDEKIRKAIINLVDTEFGDRFPFDGFTREQMLAWLEKQGEQNTDNSIWHKVEPKEYVLEKTLICKENGEIDLVEDTILSVTGAKYALPVSFLGIPKSLEKQGEMKEIIPEDATVDSNEDGLIAETIRYKNEKQGEQSKKHDVCDTCDEKDSCISPCCVKLVEEQGGQKHVGFNIGDEITVNGQVCRVVAVDKSFWSEEDEAVLDALIQRLEGEDIHVSPHLAVKCLKSLKYRVQPQPKQEWSEEDEEVINLACSILYSNFNENENFDKNQMCIGEIIDKLKSLKERYTWKPSCEQMKELKKYCPDNMPLTALYEQLKKLIEG